MIALLPPQRRADWIKDLSLDELEALSYDWDHWGRPEQQWPPGNWRTLLFNAGRGWGKTRTGAELVRQAVCGATPLTAGSYRHIGIVAETAADARDVLIEGPAGLLSVHPKDFRPLYEPSKRRITWPNGAVAQTFNAVEPDQLRGPQHDFVWLDELAKWRYVQSTWDMVQFGLRLGVNPRQIITTTPRPLDIIKKLIHDAGVPGGNVLVVRGNTLDNRANLADSAVDDIIKRYQGTRLGRQELNAEILDDVPGALWTRATIDLNRKWHDDDLPDMARVVIGIDPAAKASEDGDSTSETGVIAVGMGTNGHGYVLDDASCRLGPRGWARRALALYDRYEADCIVAEINQGGEMVEQVIRSERPHVSYRSVRATRGKTVRAEPIAALYEQGVVHHVGSHAPLEDQMVLFTPFGIEGNGMGDRVDALVWALTDLFPQIIRKDQTKWEDKPSGHQGGGGWMGT